MILHFIKGKTVCREEEEANSIKKPCKNCGNIFLGLHGLIFPNSFDMMYNLGKGNINGNFISLPHCVLGQQGQNAKKKIYTSTHLKEN